MLAGSFCRRQSNYMGAMLVHRVHPGRCTLAASSSTSWIERSREGRKERKTGASKACFKQLNHGFSMDLVMNFLVRHNMSHAPTRPTVMMWRDGGIQVHAMLLRIASLLFLCPLAPRSSWNVQLESTIVNELRCFSRQTRSRRSCPCHGV